MSQAAGFVLLKEGGEKGNHLGGHRLFLWCRSWLRAEGPPAPTREMAAPRGAAAPQGMGTAGTNPGRGSKEGRTPRAGRGTQHLYRVLSSFPGHSTGICCCPPPKCFPPGLPAIRCAGAGGKGSLTPSHPRPARSSLGSSTQQPGADAVASAPAPSSCCLLGCSEPPTGGGSHRVGLGSALWS